MKSYASIVVPPEDLALFYKIEKVIHEMPEVDLGRDKEGKKIVVSCHMICRALAKFFPVKCKDGYFGEFNLHSWLITENRLIIDPYPVAVVGGPILIDTRYMTPWRSLYHEGSFSRLSNPDFLKQVEKVTEVVRKTIEKLKTPV